MNSTELEPVEWFAITPVEWFAMELRHCLEKNGKIEITPTLLDKLAELSKEMERQRLYKFYIQGGVDACTGAKRNVEDYYNETFKQQ